MFARCLTILLVVTGLTTVFAAASSLVQDTPEHFGTVDAVCTGVGSAKEDNQWNGYPVRIEFSNRGAQFLAGERVALFRGGRRLAQFECSGPWILLKGEPGNYLVQASMETESGIIAKKSFYLGAGQQKRIELQFPDAQPNE